MKHLILSSLGLFLLISLTGCGSMKFTKYGGDQQAWPTGSAFADQVFDVPIYRGWPEKPYEIVGLVQFTNADIDWNQGDIKQASEQAQKAGGNAIILMPKGDDPSPKAVATRAQLGVSGDRTVAVVVRWK